MHEDGICIYIKEVICMGGEEKESCNSIESPENISLHTKALKEETKEITLEKNSFSVLIVLK